MPDRYYAQSHYEKLSAFSYANAASIVQVRHIQDILTEVCRRGGTFGDFRKLAVQGELGLNLPKYRLENIFRTNIMTAYARGSYLEQAESAELFPWGKYTAIKDSATRPNHLALDGVVVKFGTPEYNKIYPPNGYQCRCVMRALTNRQADRERKYSDAETKSIIANNPPDKGFEGLPYLGEPPENLAMPPEVTEEELLAFMDSGETVALSEYAERMRLLEQAGANAGTKEISAAGAIPDIVPKKIKEKTKLLYDDYYQHVLDAAPKDWAHAMMNFKLIKTEEEKQIRVQLRNDLAKEYKQRGFLEKGARNTVAAREQAVKNVMFDLFKTMNDITLLGGKRLQKMTPEERWRHYLSSATDRHVEEFLRLPGMEEYKLYSAGLMKFLDPAERALLSFYTKHGDEALKTIMLKMPGTVEEQQAKKYFSMIDGIYSAVNQNVVRDPVDIHRGVNAGKGWTDRKQAQNPLSLADVFANWKQGDKTTFSMSLMQSFSEQEDVAMRFARKGEGARILFHVKSNKGLPASAVSKYMTEAEHLMQPGGKYRIASVKRNVRKNDAYLSDYDVYLEEIDLNEDTDFIFSV